MSDRAIRKFTIIDALALVVATCLGLAGVRATLLGSSSELSELALRFPGLGVPRIDDFYWPTADQSGVPVYLQYMLTITNSIRLAEPALMAWSVVLLLLRLRRPRPHWSRMILQPGTIVGVVSVLVLLLESLQLGFITFLYRVSGFEFWKGDHWNHQWVAVRSWVLEASWQVALGVFITWSILALSRQWQPEPSWIDRMGRILGLLWILSALSQVVVVAANRVESRIQHTTNIVPPPPTQDADLFEYSSNPPLPDSEESLFENPSPTSEEPADGGRCGVEDSATATPDESD